MNKTPAVKFDYNNNAPSVFSSIGGAVCSYGADVPKTPAITGLIAQIHTQLSTLTELRNDIGRAANRLFNEKSEPGNSGETTPCTKATSVTDSLSEVLSILVKETSKFDEISNHLNKVV